MAERIHSPFTIHHSPESRPILGYDPLFDIEAYRRLQGLRFQVSVDEYNRLKNQLDTRTRHNLETNLGERFKVELSQVTYQIQKGQLISTQHDEPFLEIIKRGQKYRQENGSNETARELAEVEGFKKVQSLLLDNYPTDLTSEVGSDSSEVDFKVIIISPRGQKGSIYQHNFFDIYEKRDDRIIMCRYTSCATYKQFREIVETLDPFNSLPQDPTDADFLKNPLITYKNIDEILNFFPPDAGTITRKELEGITAICSQLIINYLDNPSYKTFNALLNFADTIVRKTPTSEVGFDSSEVNRPTLKTVEQIIGFYGSLPVRQVLAGCGIQGSFLDSNIAFSVQRSAFQPFSVAEYDLKLLSGEDQYGTLEIHCEECGSSYMRTPGKLEKACRFCGGTKGITC